MTGGVLNAINTRLVSVGGEAVDDCAADPSPCCTLYHDFHVTYLDWGSYSPLVTFIYVFVGAVAGFAALGLALDAVGPLRALGPPGPRQLPPAAGGTGHEALEEMEEAATCPAARRQVGILQAGTPSTRRPRRRPWQRRSARVLAACPVGLEPNGLGHPCCRRLIPLI